MFNKFMNWIEEHWVHIFLALVLYMVVWWSYGFYMNGKYGFKFELNSVWIGVITITSTGILSLLKYLTDSKYNSEEGKKPYSENTGVSSSIGPGVSSSIGPGVSSSIGPSLIGPNLMGSGNLNTNREEIQMRTQSSPILNNPSINQTMIQTASNTNDVFIKIATFFKNNLPKLKNFFTTRKIIWTIILTVQTILGVIFIK